MGGDFDLPASVRWLLVAFGLSAAALFAAGTRDYPNLHTILDTGMFLLSGVLTLLFWDFGTRLDRPFPKWVAASFAVTLLLELIHALVTVEWSGFLAPITQASGALRPATWPPAAYILPVGVGSAVWLLHSGRARAAVFVPSLIVAAAALLWTFYGLPRYSPPTLFGITRPTLVVVPLLWLAAGWLCWKLRAADRALPILAVMALVLVIAHTAMLYSRAPHDTNAMIAHVGKVCAYLIVLLALMRLAADATLERVRAERALAQLNEGLERRVTERTTELAAEIEVRRQAEQRAQAQLERLVLLQQITRAIGERQDLGSIFQVTIGTLEEQLPADFSCICLRDRTSNTLTVSSVGYRSGALALEMAMTEHARIAIDENGLGRCVRGELVYEPDIGDSTFPFPQQLARGGLRSLVIAPLLLESSVFGVLVATRIRPQGFSSGECEFLRQLAEHVALAAHQAQLHGALQQAYDDLRQTQQAVMLQERLRALGQMASGIAHDINNAISPVALYTESLLETEPNLSARARGYLETTQRAIADVAHTVERMREFYRQREPQLALASVQLNSLAQQVIDLTRARWSDMPQERGTVVRLQTEFTLNLPAIMGSDSEIREALTNLVFNAVDAMPNGGTLTLRTRLAVERVEIEVSDTGVGMDENTRSRCLEPFFTTKGERGTGLGLAMVYGTVQRHGAEIDIESVPEKGTTVRLRFPIPTTLTSAPAVTDVRTVPRGLRLLVVDDDPVLLKSLRDTLETDGHTVVAVGGGQAGIDTFRTAQQHGETFDAVITDLGMPHVDGRKVAEGIRASSPSTPIILLTGWGHRLIADGEVLEHVNVILSKPPKLGEIRTALAQNCTMTDG